MLEEKTAEILKMTLKYKSGPVMSENTCFVDSGELTLTFRHD